MLIDNMMNTPAKRWDAGMNSNTGTGGNPLTWNKPQLKSKWGEYTPHTQAAWESPRSARVYIPGPAIPQANTGWKHAIQVGWLVGRSVGAHVFTSLRLQYTSHVCKSRQPSITTDRFPFLVGSNGKAGPA